jgi:hypothetical protein
VTRVLRIGKIYQAKKRREQMTTKIQVKLEEVAHSLKWCIKTLEKAEETAIHAELKRVLAMIPELEAKTPV